MAGDALYMLSLLVSNIVTSSHLHLHSYETLMHVVIMDGGDCVKGGTDKEQK